MMSFLSPFTLSSPLHPTFQSFSFTLHQPNLTKFELDLILTKHQPSLYLTILTLLISITHLTFTHSNVTDTQGEGQWQQVFQKLNSKQSNGTKRSSSFILRSVDKHSPSQAITSIYSHYLPISLHPVLISSLFPH